MTPMLRLTRAVDADAYALWLWANDPDTRRAAFDRAEIAWEPHRAWLREQLADSRTVVLIGYADDRPVGSIRFDTKDAWATARLSYVVASEARGAGYGRALVERGVELLRSEHPSTTIRAEVRRDNEASLRVFRRLAWREADGERDSIRFELS